ncbi:MAG TPA: hypothetical protein DC064_09380, partial [Cyanobacteria bacterium UBA9273]|nr:hypothetical protein [Cyanobacteria bacterium UBA9273]
MKIALLIGVSEYGYGLSQLPEAVKDVEAMRGVLEPSEMGGFDEVKTLLNPNPPVMREAIQNLCEGRTENDLVLLFFSGRQITDEDGQIYLATGITATRTTSQSPQGELIKATAVPASFVRDLLNNSHCQHQVAIFNWCLGKAEEDRSIKDSIKETKTQLGGKGWVLLTCCSYTQNSSEPENYGLSVYTRYLVEGIKTGAADRNSDSWIFVEELHEYVSRKLKDVAPAWKPEFYATSRKLKILIAKARIDDPILKYRQEAELCASCGEILPTGRSTLNSLAQSLQLTPEECKDIEAEVLQPYQEYQGKLHHYEQAFGRALQQGSLIGTETRYELRCLQRSLGLRDGDVKPIEERVRLLFAHHPPSQEDAYEDTLSDEEDITATETVDVPPSNRLFPSQKDNQGRKPAGIANSAGDKIAKPVMQRPPQAETRAPRSSDIGSKPHLVGSIPQAVPSWYMQTQPVPSTPPNPIADPPSSMTEVPTQSAPVSSFPNKVLLSLGIGGGLAALGIAIALATRAPVAPPPKPTEAVPSSVDSSPISSTKATESNQGSQPSPNESSKPTPSPQRTTCSVVVNGNIRFEPAAFRDNVIEFTKEELLVTGKQTEGGWIQVKRSNKSSAWVHRDIIADEVEEQMDACLQQNQIKIQIVDDIIPPESDSRVVGRGSEGVR